MWLVTGATGHIGNVLVRELLQRGEKLKVPFDLAAFVALFTPAYYSFAKTSPRFTPYSLAVLRSNSNINHTKATHKLGYQPRPLYENIRDAVKCFLEKRSISPETSRAQRIKFSP